MAQRPGYNQLNPFSNQPQYARQYSDSDADSYTSRNASSVPLATSGYYDGTYTPQCECHSPPRKPMVGVQSHQAPFDVVRILDTAQCLLAVRRI